MALKYYLFPMTVSETASAGKFSGLRYINAHRDRLVSIDTFFDGTSLDPLGATSAVSFVVGGNVYGFFKSYLDADRGEIIIVGKRWDFAYDVEPPKKDEEEEEGTDGGDKSGGDTESGDGSDTGVGKESQDDPEKKSE